MVPLLGVLGLDVVGEGCPVLVGFCAEAALHPIPGGATGSSRYFLLTSGLIGSIDTTVAMWAAGVVWYLLHTLSLDFLKQFSLKLVEQ